MTTATDTTRWHMTEAGASTVIGTAPDATVGVHPADDDLGTAYHRVIEVIGGGEPSAADFDRAERGGFAPIGVGVTVTHIGVGWGYAGLQGVVLVRLADSLVEATITKIVHSADGNGADTSTWHQFTYRGWDDVAASVSDVRFASASRMIHQLRQQYTGGRIDVPVPDSQPWPTTDEVMAWAAKAESWDRRSEHIGATDEYARAVTADPDRVHFFISEEQNRVDRIRDALIAGMGA